LTNNVSAHSGRNHLWTVDAVLGVCAAMLAMTVAQAALPTPPVHTKPVEAPAALAAAPPVVAENVVLIAFAQPLPGRSIVSPFGRRQLPWEEHGRVHAGVDILAPAGETIQVSADGVVVRVAQDGGYGRFVEVKHAEGLSTVYAHLGRVLPKIAPGVALKAGTPIGVVGSTGSSTGAHLHFEIRDRQDHPLNPTLFLERTFAEASDLPLREALRMPRGTRVAYVSRIPASKQAMMQAKLDAKLEAKASGPRPESAAALSAIEASLDASAVVVSPKGARPHVRFTPDISPSDPQSPRPDPAD
jgi:hypothetical protein